MHHKPHRQHGAADVGFFEIIQAAEHFRPPEMKSSQEGERRTAEHDEMKMTHDPVRIMDVDIGPRRPLNETRKPPY